MRRKSIVVGGALIAAVGFAACNDTQTAPTASADDPTNTTTTTFDPGGMASVEADVDAHIHSIMDAMNVGLADAGENYRVVSAEYVTGSGDQAGSTLLQKDVGNKQLGFDFVPGDTRRSWSGNGGTTITFAVDQTGDAVPPFGGLTGAETDAAIVRGHGTWETLTCSALGQSRNPDFGLDIGVVAFLNSLGGSPFVFADVQHAGWRDINFGGGVLGVTFTFGFTSGGAFTDIDNNGKLDAAFREIYYDPSFNWADDAVSNIDVETVALHEIGHGLSQGHFGNITIRNDGSFAASPRAVMNAFIFGVDRVLYGTDDGGHCSNWAEWPNN